MTQTVHVALTGDDGAIGSQDSPVRTVERALGISRLGKGASQIVLGAGRHVLAKTIRLDSRDDGLKLRAARGVRAALSGGRAIRGWRHAEFAGQPCWAASVEPGIDFRQLFVNGERALRPRFPRSGFYRFTGLDGQPDSGHAWLAGPDRAEFGEGDIQRWRNLDDIEIVSLQLWFDTHHRIARLDLDHNVVGFRAPSLGSLVDETGQFARYFVDNVAEAFGQPGDWYLDRPTGQVFYAPRAGEVIDEIDAIAPVLERLVELEGCNDVRFDGITFEHAEWRLGSDDPGFIQAAFGVPGAIVFEGARDCALHECEVRHVSQYGVEMLPGSSRNAIVACEFHDIGAGAIKIGHDGYDHTDATSRGLVERSELPMQATVIDCWLHDTGRLYPGSVAVWVGNSGRNRILHNEIYDVPYTAISCGWSWGYAPTLTVDNLIAFNHIHRINADRLLSDNGGIYLLGVQPGTRVLDNRIHHVGRYDYGGWGIYADEGTSEVVIENNLVHDTDDAGMRIHYGRDILIQNNIFAFSGSAHLSLGKPESHRTARFERNVVVWKDGDVASRFGDWDPSHNLVSDCLLWSLGSGAMRIDGATIDELQANGQFTGCVLADPLFIAPGARALDIRDDSPAAAVGFIPFATSHYGPRPYMPAARPTDHDTDQSPRAIVRSSLSLVPDERDPLTAILRLTCTNIGAIPAEGRIAIRDGTADECGAIDLSLDAGSTVAHEFQVALTPGRNLFETIVSGDGMIPTAVIHDAMSPSPSSV